jgi:phosphatidylglycerol:prolipoprotein diacylglycerol transferase
MLAAIPYFVLQVWNVQIPGLGTIPIDPWATLVCVGFVVGLEIARHRAIRLGLEVRDIVDGAVFTVLSGFFFGHVFTVLAYFPERLSTDGVWALLKVWEGFSSFGGFIGAVIGASLFYGVFRRKGAWRHADVITFGFPFGWFFGRVGCGVVHDHVGARTSFPLAMDFDHGLWGTGDPAAWADGVRHELGLYEAAFMLGICALWVVVGRRDRVPGFFLGLFGVTYAPVRFFLEFLRNQDLHFQDARYFGLTPGHYSAIAMFAGGALVLATRDWKGFRPWPMDRSADQGQAASADRVRSLDR